MAHTKRELGSVAAVSLGAAFASDAPPPGQVFDHSLSLPPNNTTNKNISNLNNMYSMFRDGFLHYTC